jgi:hypothetical protein
MVTQTVFAGEAHAGESGEEEPNARAAAREQGLPGLLSDSGKAAGYSFATLKHALLLLPLGLRAQPALRARTAKIRP